MQKAGINVESFDLSEVFAKVGALKADDPAVLAKGEYLRNYTDFSGVPAQNFDTLCKLSVVLDGYIAEYHLDALALRCWNELETYLRICPCVLLSELNDRGITASCEIDMTEREQEIFHIIQQNPAISQNELADRLGIARSSVAVHIANLQKKGYILGKGYIVNNSFYVVGVGAANVDIHGRSKAPIVMRDSNPGHMFTDAEIILRQPLLRVFPATLGKL